jgi:isopentenyl diphosphate isomerase/L-lactate dehydrogenase-like FMN-dependent dehydrogenase
MQKWKTMSGDKPFLVKGIQSVDDARKAVELGVDGIVCQFLNRVVGDHHR